HNGAVTDHTAAGHTSTDLELMERTISGLVPAVGDLARGRFTAIDRLGADVRLVIEPSSGTG
ncbi:MAG: hypothetical protein ACR2O6_09360, partial [Ilumatobacteraceae bacterium]